MGTLLTEDPIRNDYLKELIRKALDERRKVIFVTSHVAHAKFFYDEHLCEQQAILAGPHQMPLEAKSKETRIV